MSKLGKCLCETYSEMKLHTFSACESTTKSTKNMNEYCMFVNTFKRRSSAVG